MTKKTHTILTAIFISLACSTYAIQVLPPSSTGIGESFGKGFGDGFNQGMAMAFAENLRENEIERRLEVEKSILTEILKDYDPSRNSQFVAKILESKLSNKTKEVVINALTEQQKIYLEEQKKNDRGFLSWLKK